MQEIDRFDGVVIVTTNLFENYDPALLRRIQRHIKFRHGTVGTPTVIGKASTPVPT